MATVVDALVVTLGLDPSGVSSGMKQAEKTISAASKSIIRNVIAPLAGTFAFSALLNNFVKTGTELSKLSRRLKMNAVDIQAWQGAMEAAGEDVGALQGTLAGIEEKLKLVRLGRWSGEFAMMGIKVRDANGNIKDAGQILEDLAKVADKMDPKRFAFFAKKFGIDDATIRLLQKGSKEVDILLNRYKNLALTQKDIEIADRFRVAQGNMFKALQAGAAIIMRVVVPAFTFISDKIGQFINYLREHEPFVVGIFVALAAVIAPFAAMVAASIAGAMLPFVPFFALISAFALLFDDLWTYIQGGESALGDYWSQLGTGEEILAQLNEAWEQLKAIGVAVWEALTPAASRFFEIVASAVGPFVGMFQSALKMIRALFEGDFGAAFGFATDLITNFAQFVWTILSGVFQAVLDLVINIFSSIGSFFTDLFNSILGTITNAIKSIISKIPSFMLPDGLKQWAASADAAVAAQAKAPPGANASAADASMAISPSVANSTSDNSVTNNSEINVTQNITTSDPAAAASQSSAQLNSLVNNSNTAVNRGD